MNNAAASASATGWKRRYPGPLLPDLWSDLYSETVSDRRSTPVLPDSGSYAYTVMS